MNMKPHSEPILKTRIPAACMAVMLAATVCAGSELEPPVAAITHSNSPVTPNSQVTLSPGDVVSFRIAEDQEAIYGAGERF